MRLKQLLADDEAVSPVIGVILMVAITVILAAVIASFVLGLGSQAQTTPSAAFSVDYTSASDSVGASDYDGNLTITHDSGDPITEQELYLRGDSLAELDTDANSWENYRTSGAGDFPNVGSSEPKPTATTSGTSEGESAVVAGDRLTTGADSDYELSVVFESAEGDSSSTLATDSGPDAN